MPEPGKPGPEPARYGDDGGLHLVVAPAGGKSWVFRAISAARVGLADARDKAIDARRMSARGENPFAERRRAGAPAVPTFQAAAESTIAIDKPTRDDARPEAQWRSSLANCAHPKLNALSVPSGAFGDG